MLQDRFHLMVWDSLVHLLWMNEVGEVMAVEVVCAKLVFWQVTPLPTTPRPQRFTSREITQLTQIRQEEDLLFFFFLLILPAHMTLVSTIREERRRKCRLFHFYKIEKGNWITFRVQIIDQLVAERCCCCCCCGAVAAFIIEFVGFCHRVPDCALCCCCCFFTWAKTCNNKWFFCGADGRRWRDFPLLLLAASFLQHNTPRSADERPLLSLVFPSGLLFLLKNCFTPPLRVSFFWPFWNIYNNKSLQRNRGEVLFLRLRRRRRRRN